MQERAEQPSREHPGCGFQLAVVLLYLATVERHRRREVGTRRPEADPELSGLRDRKADQCSSSRSKELTRTLLAESSSFDLKRNEEPAGKLAEGLASVRRPLRHAKMKQPNDHLENERKHASREEERK